MRRASLSSILTLCVLAALVAAATVVSAAGLPKWDKLSRGYSYDQYLRDIGKERPASAEEHARRARIFAEELDAVLEHNADGTQLYRQGLNQFSDRTPEEKATAIMGVGRMHLTTKSDRRAGGRLSQAMLQAVTAGAEPMRRELDYRRANPPVLTAVKDQGACGSCWAFSTTETIESHVAIQTGRLFDLSMQQMVSCVPAVNISIDYGNQTFHQEMGGCGGYIPSWGIEYVVEQQNGKMSQEYEIPYQSYWDQVPNASAPDYRPTPPCMNAAHRTFTTVNVTGYVQNPANDEVALQDVLFQQGPVVTVMYVPQSFFAYEAGVYAGTECIMNDEMTPSHAVQIMGYGYDAESKQAYWIVRNSWAPIWGENGYFRLLRTDPTMCGKMSLPMNSTSTTMVPLPACGTCGILGWTVYPLV